MIGMNSDVVMEAVDSGSALSWHAWATLAVVFATVILLAGERLSPSVAILGGVCILLFLGVIDERDAFAGFSSSAPVTVAALYIVAAAARTTGALGFLTAPLRSGNGYRRDLVHILPPVAGGSAFLNNTPIVAVLGPQVAEWARRYGKSPSSYLMPISYAAILGGMLSLVGTSTNIVVSEILADIPGQEAMGLFEIAWIGFPIVFVGLSLLILVGPVFLPLRHGAGEQARENVRDFIVEMVVTDSPLAGVSVEEARLRHLEGVFLVEIERKGRTIAPVSPSQFLRKNDRLIFAGNVSRIVDLQQIRGLKSAEHQHFEVGTRAVGQQFFEGVVAVGSPLAGATLQEVGFRARYGGAVVAIHRAGERIGAKLGGIVLRPGDVLLILADASFPDRWRESKDFLVVSVLGGTNPVRTSRAPWVLGIIGVLMGLVSLGGVPILQASLLAVFALLLTQVLSISEARSAVDLDVIITLAGSFGLGAGVTKSGLADHIAGLLVDVFANIGGERGILLGVLLATMLLTEAITNNAAAILMAAIALAVANDLGVDPRPLFFAVAIGASASFLTPVGYQTNMMVYAMGGYRYGDFFRVGFPLSLAVLALAVWLIPEVWPFS